MWGTKVENQKIDLLLMRAQLKNGDLENVRNIASAIRSAKQDTYSKIILTCNPQTLDFYGYFYLDTPSGLPPIESSVFLGAHASAFAEAQIGRMVIEDDVKGFSDGISPPHRYVVEMDPEAGWQEKLFAWYNEEHLPGLASVPGCIAAIRCINLDHSPNSFAFYDLTKPEVLGCEPWLKVRNTAWSDRVRPHFTNVKRTMFSLF